MTVMYFLNIINQIKNNNLFKGFKLKSNINIKLCFHMYRNVRNS